MNNVLRITNRQWKENDYVEKGDPVLITDGLREWPVMGRWSPAFLKEKCGKHRTVVHVSHTGKWNFTPDGLQFEPKTQYALPNVPFDLAVDWILASAESLPKYYITYATISQYPELATDLQFERPLSGTLVTLWFGSSGTVTPLHYDRQHNLFAQIYGTKTLTLFNPLGAQFLCQSIQGSAGSHVSSIDIELDPRVYSLRTDARFQVTVEPGQILFIPAYWWHHVRATDTSISVNQWWKPALDECRGPTVLHHWLGEYKRDGWCLFRTREEIGIPELVRAAEVLVNVDPPLAAVILAVAGNEIVRSPVYRDALRSLKDQSVREAVDSLTANVLENHLDGISAAPLTGMIDRLREIASLDEPKSVAPAS